MLRRRPPRLCPRAHGLALAGVAVLGALGATNGPWSGDASADDSPMATVVERDPAVSGDGRRVVFVAPTEVVDPGSGPIDSVWMVDRSTGERTELTPKTAGIRAGRSIHPILSDDGCSVGVVTELALDLFRDDDHGSRWDVYRTVLPGCPGAFEPGEWEIVSSTSDPEPKATDAVDPSDRPTMDASGNVVGYTRVPAPADGLAPVAWSTIEIADLTVPLGLPGRITEAPGRPAGGPVHAGSYLGQRQPALSGDGRYLAFTTDIEITVVETDTAAAFTGDWTDRIVDGAAVTQVVRWDRLPSDDDEASLVRTVSAGPDGAPGDGWSAQAVLDADGDVVAFTSVATNLLAGADGSPSSPSPAGVPQVYRAGLADPAGITRISAQAGTAADGASSHPSIDAAGRLIAFESLATNLVTPAPAEIAEPTGADLLLADSGQGTIRRITTQLTGLPQSYGARMPRLSSTGRTIVYETVATELAPDAVGTGADTVGSTGAVMDGQPSPDQVGPSPDQAAPWHVAISVAPVQLSISDLDLGTAAVGTSTETWFTTIVNNGSGAFVPASITTTTPEFSIAGGTCRRSVPVLSGESCTVELTFTPTADGPATGELVVTERGFGAVEVRAGLRAVGGTPNVEAIPSSLDFGPALVMLPGSSQVVTFANNGVAETGVSSLSFGGTHPDDFNVVTDGCTGHLLSVGETCIVRLAFVPMDSGPRSATLTAHATSGAAAGVVVVGSARYTPIAAIEQTHAAVPGRVDVVGLGFPVHAYVSIGWDGSDRTAIALTDERGELRYRLDAPRSLGGGRRTVLVIDPAGHFEPVRTPEIVLSSSGASGGASSPAHRGG